MAWNPQKNDIFFQRVSNVAYELQSISEEIARLAEIWTAENVSASPVYVDANGMTVADITSMISVVSAYQNFLDDKAVSQADRRAVLAVILAARG